jgi:hypothetical protein
MFQLLDFSLEPSDMPFNLFLHWSQGGLGSILLSRDHVHHLASPGHLLAQGQLGLVAYRPGFRFHGGPKSGNQLGIYAVRLGQLPFGSGKGAYPGRIDHRHRYAGLNQVTDQSRFDPARGFQHHQLNALL